MADAADELVLVADEPRADEAGEVTMSLVSDSAEWPVQKSVGVRRKRRELRGIVGNPCAFAFVSSRHHIERVASLGQPSPHALEEFAALLFLAGGLFLLAIGLALARP